MEAKIDKLREQREQKIIELQEIEAKLDRLQRISITLDAIDTDDDLKKVIGARLSNIKSKDKVE